MSAIGLFALQCVGSMVFTASEFILFFGRSKSMTKNKFSSRFCVTFFSVLKCLLGGKRVASLILR